MAISMSIQDPETMMPGAFSEYGVPVEDLPTYTEVTEEDQIVIAGLVDWNKERFVDVYRDAAGYEFTITNDNRQ